MVGCGVLICDFWVWRLVLLFFCVCVEGVVGLVALWVFGCLFGGCLRIVVWLIACVDVCGCGRVRVLVTVRLVDFVCF